MTVASVAKGIEVDPRLAGPAGVGNDDYMSELIAKHFNGPVQVTLYRSVPLDRPLHLEWYEQHVAMACDGADVIATIESVPTRTTHPGIRA